MRHVPDGVLRRLDDEPLAVPDMVLDHVAGCERCGARRSEIAQDAEHARLLLRAARPEPDIDVAWAGFERELLRRADTRARRRHLPTEVPMARARLPRVSLRAGLLIGAVGVVLAGTAAAATLTNIFAPTHVAAVSLSRSDLQAIGELTGLGDGQSLGGFGTASGSTTSRFGTIRWSSHGAAQPVSSLADAVAQAGFRVPLPAHLPTGVGSVPRFTVQRRVTASVTLNSTAPSLEGSMVTIDVGPAVVAEYGGTSEADLPTLSVVTMPRPTASSTGANMSQIEAFLLGQPGIPPQLAEEIRLLGDLRTVLPVPVPSGASVHSVRVSGWPGILLADSSNVAAAVVWEDGRGMLHVVAGILDAQDVLNVADQLG